MQHATVSQPRRRRAGGMTLIEILVVIGIIVLLVAIALPVLLSSWRQARNTRAAADMVSIGTGLDAYRTDFGDYPRPDTANTGFAVLGKALLAPGPRGGPLPALGPAPHYAGTIAHTGTPGQLDYKEHVALGFPNSSGGFSATDPTSGTDIAPPNPEYWGNMPVSDGKDGPGFRARPGGKPFGPYIQDGKFRVRGLAILDAWDNPILYFPARPRKPAPNGSGEWPLLGLTPTTANGALYNFLHNQSFFFRINDTDAVKAHKRAEAVLIRGNKDWNGQINPGETAVTDRAYLLWSAGPDRNFGATFAGTNPTPDEIRKVDDITNFTTGQ